MIDAVFLPPTTNQLPQTIMAERRRREIQDRATSIKSFKYVICD